MENMNLGNMYHYKKKHHPEWYTNGEAKTFTPEEIAAYETTPQAVTSLAKAEEVRTMGPDLVKFLDSKKSGEAEAGFKEQMKGFKG